LRIDKRRDYFYNERNGGIIMHIVVIDGQGGRLGAGLVSAVKEKFPQAKLTAIGTNAIATAAMLKAGAERGATGENPVVVACRTADVIVGPIAIIAADALLGEVTPTMAAAIGAASAKKVLIPMNRCGIRVMGVAERSMNEYIALAMEEIGQ
jgi:hypothetical protein